MQLTVSFSAPHPTVQAPPLTSTRFVTGQWPQDNFNPASFGVDLAILRGVALLQTPSYADDAVWSEHEGYPTGQACPPESKITQAVNQIEDAAAALPRSQFMAVKSNAANMISAVATARIDGSICSRTPLHI